MKSFPRDLQNEATASVASLLQVMPDRTQPRGNTPWCARKEKKVAPRACAGSVLGRGAGRELCEESPEQPGLLPELALLGAAGGWIRASLGALPACIILGSYPTPSTRGHAG